LLTGFELSSGIVSYLSPNHHNAGHRAVEYPFRGVAVKTFRRIASLVATRRQLLAGAGGAVLVAGGVGSLLYDLPGEDGGGDSMSAQVLVAGSLLQVAGEVAGGMVEAHGSAAVQRLVVEGLREPDAVAVADPRLLAGISPEGRLFATNALVIVYDPDSSHADALADDWRSAVQQPDIRIGRTDPQVDPLGYRTVLAMRLASESGVDTERVLDASSIHPETEVLNLVESGTLDAAFVYRNMAVERGLPAVDLPASIDFSDPSRADRYRSVSVTVQGQKLPGTPIRYAATALTERGEPWVEALVAGRDRLEASGFVVPDDYPRTVDVPDG